MVRAMSELLSCVELEPPNGNAATAAVLWLHGLGADGHDFVEAVPHLGLGEAPVRFVFPNAPAIPVTLNAGMVMPAWYDIRDMDLRRRHDEAGIRRSAEQIEALIAREVDDRGVPAERIVLAGFSQGGAMALHVGLRHRARLAGIVALSTYLVSEDSLGEEVAAANRETPIFQAHGTVDPMVAVERGAAARDRLRAMGYEVAWHDYPMAHQVCLEELEAIGAFLRERLRLVSAS